MSFCVLKNGTAHYFVFTGQTGTKSKFRLKYEIEYTVKNRTRNPTIMKQDLV